ncbi:MAG: hypothetical protein ACTS5A_02160 [Candidatus Hodgkinia cicadicola]
MLNKLSDKCKLNGGQLFNLTGMKVDGRNGSWWIRPLDGLNWLLERVIKYLRERRMHVNGS